MGVFRRIRKSDPNVPHFSPTEFCTCPEKLLDKKNGVPVVFGPETLEIFEKGSEIHLDEAILRDGANNLVAKDLHMTVIKDDLSYIFSGYLDFLMYDLKGKYIEDLKSCNRKAFYHFNKNGPSQKEKLQVSLYGYLYFLLNRVRIKRGMITKIDRSNPRNRISLEFDLIPIEEMEEFVINHPVIMFLDGKINRDTFLKLVREYISKNQWLCGYCDKSKTCKIINNKEVKNK